MAARWAVQRIHKCTEVQLAKLDSTDIKMMFPGNDDETTKMITILHYPHKKLRYVGTTYTTYKHMFVFYT